MNRLPISPDRPFPLATRESYTRDQRFGTRLFNLVRTAPTGSPRLFSTVTMPSSPGSRPSRRKNVGKCRTNGAKGAVLDLERDAQTRRANRRRTGPRRHPSRPSRGTLGRTPRRPRSTPRASPGARQSPRRPAQPPSSRGSRAKAWAQRSRGSANVGTPQPSTATGIESGSTSAAPATSAQQLALQRMRREAVAVRLVAALAAEDEKARVLPEHVCSSGVGSGPVSRSASVAGAAASNARTASSCSGRCPCDAHAIAISRSSRSGRARTSGSAWSGFAAERRKVRTRASPASATICPSRTATACTVCSASTTSPRVTSTWIGSAIAGTLRRRCPSYPK